VIKLILDPDGKLVAVESDGGLRGVVRPPNISTDRFMRAVREEFPELVLAKWHR
jgi:hypothetical protein